METHFSDPRLERLAREDVPALRLAAELVRAYRKKLGLLRAAVDERDLYALKSNHFEKLQGDRSHQRSLRLNAQYRLIVEIRKASPKNVVVVVGIEDYH